MQTATNIITIIGGGNLGFSIAEGLLKTKKWSGNNLVVTRRNVAALMPLTKKGVAVSSDNNAAVKNANVIILAVKPWQVKDVVEEFQKSLKNGQILVSVVTGVSVSDIQSFLGNKKVQVFRAMPNTAIAIQQSMTCISVNDANPEQINTVTEIFEALGKVVFINEALMDSATVLGACGTAFAMRFIRANIQGGVEIGFDAKTASLIASQTIKGAAEMLLVNGTHPEFEIDKVTTPKGCTIAGLNEMEHQGFSSSIIKGVAASYNKIVKG